MSARLEPRVNLLPVDRFEYSKAGRFLQWMLTTGRHVLMLTELVVIIAFLSRFWFDRRLTDLKETRMQKEVLVDSYSEVFQSYSETQSQLTAIRRTLRDRLEADKKLERIQSLTPKGIEFEDIAVSSQSANVRGVASSSLVFSALLSSLTASPDLLPPTVKLLKLSRDHSPGFDFELDLKDAVGSTRQSLP